jgi:hypothetical protein
MDLARGGERYAARPKLQSMTKQQNIQTYEARRVWQKKKINKKHTKK